MKAKQKKENLQWQVGLFFSLGLGLTVLAVFLLGAKKGFFTEHYVLSCYFDDISGLRVGSPVRLAGIKVGMVSDISFEEVLVADTAADAGTAVAAPLKPVVKVKTLLQLDQNYQTRICTDSTASVVTEGLLGDRIIFLTVGCRKPVAENGILPPPPKPLKNGDVLTQVAEPKGFNDLVDQGDVLMQKATALVDNMNKVMRGITEGDGLAHKLIYDPQVATSLDHVQATTQNLQTTSQNLENITQKIDQGQGTVGALINDPSLYNDVKLLLGKANRNKLVRSVVRYTLKTKDKDHLK